MSITFQGTAALVTGAAAVTGEAVNTSAGQTMV
jgi:hypothetical protein